MGDGNSGEDEAGPQRDVSSGKRSVTGLHGRRGQTEIVVGLPDARYAGWIDAGVIEGMSKLSRITVFRG
jgi:hypothetical protein